MIFGSHYPFLTLASFFLFLLLSIYSLRFRKAIGAGYLIASMILLAFLSIASVNELTSQELQSKIWWRNIEQIPLFISPLLIYGAVLELTGIKNREVNRRLLLLGIPIMIYLALIFTDSLHHLMRKTIAVTSFGENERLQVESTLLSMLFIVYTRFLGFASIWKLFVNLKNVSVFHRRQYYAIIVALFIPYLLTLCQKFIGISMNTATASIATGLFIFYSIVQDKLFRVSPVAKDQIIENLKEGIVVIDQNDIIIDVNPSAFSVMQSLTDDHAEQIVGKNIRAFFEGHPNLAQFYAKKQQGEIEIELVQGYYSVHLVPILLKKGIRSFLVIFTDITDRKKYEKDLYERATVDYLTKVYNRQYLFETAVKQIRQIDTFGHCVSLLVLDVDKFKSINDTFGHKFGDVVLEKLGQVLQATVGDAGTVGRTGGEEFAVFLPGFTELDAYDLAEKIRRRVQEIQISTEKQDYLEITISLGIKTISSSKITFEELYQQADRALYLSKNNGRNQTTAIG